MNLHRKILTVCVVFACSACTRGTPLSGDPQVANRQAKKLFPVGTSETQVKRILTEKGFHVSRLNPDSAANHLLVGSYGKGNQTWLVGIIIINDRVAATSVTISVGPKS